MEHLLSFGSNFECIMSRSWATEVGPALVLLPHKGPESLLSAHFDVPGCRSCPWLILYTPLRSGIDQTRQQRTLCIFPIEIYRGLWKRPLQEKEKMSILQ